ncbi:Arc family DNA-binding protein [Mangrovibacter plantisponsor]|uniref:Arc-like DNA binding dprotein n=1 Tax=Mangrovibacter plantisponsor TaxID=451513 RepID=A0A317PML3_9ENTR|nr:Arc family DNA-binding protein [Mangrovibacter plantisponsor]PWV99559.1 Arc-like DNA binding dprotein [Mangrovibacter plantisponsor]
MKGASLIAPFGLRMPEDLKEQIIQRAKINSRSMNAEIIQMLNDAMHTDEQTPELIKLRQEVTNLKLMLALQERYIELIQDAVFTDKDAEAIERNKKISRDISSLVGDDLNALLDKASTKE